MSWSHKCEDYIFYRTICNNEVPIVLLKDLLVKELCFLPYFLMRCFTMDSKCKCVHTSHYGLDVEQSLCKKRHGLVHREISCVITCSHVCIHKEASQVDGRCAPHLTSLHSYKTPFILIPGFLRCTQSAQVCTYEPYFKYKRGVIVVQNRHRTSAYFRSAIQVQRKSILSTVLLMYPPPTWAL